MKIRIKSNSLRYRLTRTDVANLVETGRIQDKIDFAGQALTYSLQLTVDEQLKCSFKNSKITLFMPKRMLMEMADTDKVGFENSIGGIYLLVEKDFTCLDNVAEDQRDNYPNPLAEKIYEQGN